MADIMVEVDTPANKGVKAGDPDTAQATVDDDEFDDQSPVPWGSVGAKKGSVIKNGSQHRITDIHIRRTDRKKFDQKSTGGKGFPNAPKFSNNDTEVEFSGGNIPNLRRIGDRGRDNPFETGVGEVLNVPRSP